MFNADGLPMYIPSEVADKSISPRWKRIILRRAAWQILLDLKSPLVARGVVAIVLFAVIFAGYSSLWYGTPIEQSAWQSLQTLATLACIFILFLLVEYVKTRRFCGRLVRGLRKIRRADIMLFADHEQGVLQDGEMIRDCFRRAGWKVVGVNAASSSETGLEGVRLSTPDYQLLIEVKKAFRRAGIRAGHTDPLSNDQSRRITVWVHSRVKLPWRGFNYGERP